MDVRGRPMDINITTTFTTTITVTITITVIVTITVTKVTFIEKYFLLRMMQSTIFTPCFHTLVQETHSFISYKKRCMNKGSLCIYFH